MWKFENQFTLQNYLGEYNEIFMKVSECMMVKRENVLLLLTIDIVDGKYARLPLQGGLGSHVNRFLNFYGTKVGCEGVHPVKLFKIYFLQAAPVTALMQLPAPPFNILYSLSSSFHTRICGNKASMSKHQKTFHWVMQDRDKRFFCRFFFIFDSSPTLANDSDFVDLLLRNFLLRKLQKLSVDEALSNCSRSNFCKSFSVCEGFSDFRKTSLIKSGWLFSSDREEVHCLTKVLCLHAVACGKELGRTAKEWCLVSVYVPPERSSKNSSSSDELMRSSASEDWRESDCWANWYTFLTSFNSNNVLRSLTWFIRRLGGDLLFQSASSWSKCCDWARAACSGLPMFCCEPMLFISAIFEISSMLVDTENRRLSLSSTCAIITDDVKCAYFFCHEYVSSDSSFLRSLRAGRFAAAGRKSENPFSWAFHSGNWVMKFTFDVPCRSRVGR